MISALNELPHVKPDLVRTDDDLEKWYTLKGDYGVDSVSDPKSRKDGMAERKKTTRNSKALRRATTEQWNGGRTESHSKS